MGCLREEGQGRTQQARRGDARRRRATFLAAPAILAAAGLLFGLWPSPLDNALDTYADTVPGDGDYELALWHGFNLPLLLSALVLAIGTAAFFARSRLPRRKMVYLPLGNADRIYDAVIRGADVLSVRLTGTTQRGSIPGHPVGDPGHARDRAGGGAGARGARPARVRAVGFAAPGDRRRC